MKTLSYERNNNGEVILTLSMSLDEFNDHFVRCESCGKIIHLDNAFEFKGEYYCDDCTDTCNECGQVLSNNHLCCVEDSSVRYYPSCFDKVTYECRDCGEYFRYSDSVSEKRYSENCNR